MAAATRLWATEMACMSPVRWRLNSSIGTTWLYPPPAAPPLIPNVGPMLGCRMQAMDLCPRAPRPWTRPMVVVVLPSPSGVGVMAVTSTYLPIGITCDPAQGIEMDFGLGGAVRDDLFFFESEVPRHLSDRLEFGGAGDLEIARHS